MTPTHTRNLLLLDTNALLHRSRSSILRGVGQELTTSTGLVTTGTFGFLNVLFKAIADYDISSVVAAYDKGGNWRKKANSEYKANRDKPKEEFISEFETLVESVLPDLGIPPIGVYGYEADDIIATISRQAPPNTRTIIFTCDKDLLQLVTNKTHVLLFNTQKKIQLVTPDNVEEHFGVRANEIPLYKALVGDKSDNVSGVQGIGAKSALKLIIGAREYENQVDGILLNMKKDQDTFRECLKLVNLSQNVPGLKWFSSSPPTDSNYVRGLFEAFEFTSFLKDKRFDTIFNTLSQISPVTV